MWRTHSSSRALATVPADRSEFISQELAALTNQVVIADGCDPGELAEVRRCVELSARYLNIGLAFLAEGEATGRATAAGNPAPSHFSGWLRAHSGLCTTSPIGLTQISERPCRAWETY